MTDKENGGAQAGLGRPPRTPPRDKDTPLELVGIAEIATLLAVPTSTVNTWRSRKILPEEDYLLSGTPVWIKATILRWSERTHHPRPKYD